MADGPNDLGGAELPELPELPELEETGGVTIGGPGSSGSGALSSASLAAGLTPGGLGFDVRAIVRKLGRVALWGFGLLMIFLVSAWISLPTRSIAWRISHEARKAGFNITVEDISLYPWGSATLEEVSWNFKPSRPDSTPVPFIIEELDVGFSIFKYLLFDEIDVEFEGKMDEGMIAGAFSQGEDESHVAFNISDLPLYGVPKLQDSVNAPVRGLFALDIDITAPNNEWAKSDGHLEIHCYSCTIGDGDTKLYVPGTKKTSMLSKGVKIPEIDLGTLDGVLEISDGKAVAEEFGTESNDIVFKISGDIEFKDPVATTRLNLTIKMFIDPSLRERSDSVDLLVLTASEKVKMDPPDEGWMAVVLEGNFKNRRFRGIKQMSRQERLRAKREARKNRARDRSKRRAEQQAVQREAKAATGDSKPGEAGDEGGGAAAGGPEESGSVESSVIEKRVDEGEGEDEGEDGEVEDREVEEEAAGEEEEGGDEEEEGRDEEEEGAAGEEEEAAGDEEEEEAAGDEEEEAAAGEEETPVIR